MCPVRHALCRTGHYLNANYTITRYFFQMKAMLHEYLWTKVREYAVVSFGLEKWDCGGTFYSSACRTGHDQISLVENDHFCWTQWSHIIHGWGGDSQCPPLLTNNILKTAAVNCLKCWAKNEDNLIYQDLRKFRTSVILPQNLKFFMTLRKKTDLVFKTEAFGHTKHQSSDIFELFSDLPYLSL